MNQLTSLKTVALVTVTVAATLSADGNTQTSSNTGQVLDVAGTVIQSNCATDVSTRVF